MTSTVRNVLIVLLLALAVYALPGGGLGAEIVGTLISIAFSVGIWFFLMRLYRENRMTIFGLDDRFRLVLYAALAGLLFVGASAGRWWESGPLTFLWFVVFGACVYGLVLTWRHFRSYA